MNSRTLSALLVPSSWAQQQQKKPTPSISSSSSHHSSRSWSNMSLDQLSNYAKVTSTTSLSLISGSNSNSGNDLSEELEKKRAIQQREKIRQAIEGFQKILLLSLNECSLGFYRIFDHIHRKVPQIVQSRKKLAQTRQKVNIANSNIEDVRKSVCDIERIESFYNINKMIQTSIIIILNNSSKR